MKYIGQFGLIMLYVSLSQTSNKAPFLVLTSGAVCGHLSRIGWKCMAVLLTVKKLLIAILSTTIQKALGRKGTL